MKLSELIKKRYSARKYDPKKVEKEKLMEILEAGRVALQHIMLSHNVYWF